jgi:hypothetical protein
VGALLGEVVGAHPLPAARPGASPARPPRCSPSTSLFLVSTPITGCPAAANSLTWPLRYRNCASRSGWRAPWVVREVPSQGEPSASGQRGHRVRAHRVPRRVSSAASFRVDLHLQPKRGLRVPTLSRLDQRQQGRDQTRIALAQPFAARPTTRTRSAHSPPNSRAPRATVDSATRATRATRRHPHIPTPGQPLPTPGAAAAHPDGAAARRTPPRAPPRSVSSRRDPMAQLPHQTHQLLIGDSLPRGLEPPTFGTTI